jgi:aldehyde:ferredoxin oxidoreductase
MSPEYRPDFRIMLVDLTRGKGEVVTFPDRALWVGGSGLAAGLFAKYGVPDAPWDDPRQPLIFAIGPLTGYFPLMSKTVCAFKSPYHDQYAESHAGGRSALSLLFAGVDALVITGRAARPVALALGSRRLSITDAHFLWGADVFTTGKRIRKLESGASGHRSIWRIGPAGENKLAYACINVDTYRHFGRLGSGAVMGAKNLKAILVNGDADLPLPAGKDYAKLFQKIFTDMTGTDMMSKYHSLGTAVNLKGLDELKSLPWHNLQATSDPGIEGVTGQKFADDTLLRNAACAGCPVGCIHIGFVREKFDPKENRYLYRQVAYDYEPIFSCGTMLGVTDAFQVLAIMDTVEKYGLDVMSAGVALAWATEAFQKGLVTEKETLVPLSFGDAQGYKEAVYHLGHAANEFYRTLGQGALTAGKKYGGADFACVLGQEMAGYATGEAFFVAESLGFRHSHLDTGAYSMDQKSKEKDVGKTVAFLVKDERERIMTTSMVACLFARGVYKEEVMKEALRVIGAGAMADNWDAAAAHLHQARWKCRLDTGYDPLSIQIPKRFTEVVTWKGGIDTAYMEELRQAYARAIVEVGRGGEG